MSTLDKSYQVTEMMTLPIPPKKHKLLFRYRGHLYDRVVEVSRDSGHTIDKNFHCQVSGVQETSF